MEGVNNGGVCDETLKFLVEQAASGISNFCAEGFARQLSVEVKRVLAFVLKGVGVVTLQEAETLKAV